MKPALGLNLSEGGLGELKRRLLFLLVGILIYRIGAHVPVPGLDPKHLVDLFDRHGDGLIGLLNMFSGGALSRLSIFALGVIPYISASIVVQLFTGVSPKLEQLRREGESGRRKLSQYTRMGTIVLATFHAIGMCKWLIAGGVAYAPGLGFVVIATVSLVTGTMFLMWLGEQITEYGVGNGISMIIFSGIVANLPSAMGGLMQQVRQGQMQGITLLLIMGLVMAVVGFVVFVERGQRRIKINYAQRQRGRRVYAAQSTHLPLKVNSAGVIPLIFASSIILLPMTLAQFFTDQSGTGILSDLSMLLSQGQPLYLISMAVGIIFFSFLYVAIEYNPRKTSDRLKKEGAYIPGIRPGEQTRQYLDGVMSRMTMVGALYLVLVSLLPELMRETWHVTFYFGGTSLLIVVVVVMDLVAQVQAHLMSHQYESLMKKANLKGGMNGMGLLR